MSARCAHIQHRDTNYVYELPKGRERIEMLQGLSVTSQKWEWCETGLTVPKIKVYRWEDRNR